MFDNFGNDEKPSLPIEEKSPTEDTPPIDEPEYLKILKEHGGLESNIPYTSHYWRIRP